LLASHRYADARQDWTEFSGGPKDPPNLLFNGGFEDDPTGAVLDWRIEPSADVRTGIDDAVAHDGKRSLRIEFLGDANVSYANATEWTVAPPGSYDLSAWIRTAGITTNECPRLEVFDPELPSRLDVRTEAFCGSRDWTLVNQHLRVPATASLLAVRVVRLTSGKFDNKIAGTFWLDSVRLAPAHD